MWVSKKKADEFFNLSIEMVETCNNDVTKLTLTMTELAEMVTNMRKLIEIQNQRIELLEKANAAK